MLQDTIKSQIKDAMLAKDTVRLDVLRGMSAAFTNELVAKGKKPQDVLSDEEALAVITRLSKQRKDSIEQYEKANRPELVAEETAQLEILKTFLPTLMSKEEVTAFVQSKMSNLGADPTKKGMIMGTIMRELKGKADGSDVKEAVDALLK